MKVPGFTDLEIAGFACIRYNKYRKRSELLGKSVDWSGVPFFLLSAVHAF